MAVLIGFHDYADTMTELITTIGEEAVYDAVVESAKWHSEQIKSVLSWVQEGTHHQELVKISNDVELQPITENTSPDPRRVIGKFTQGYPMRQSGTGIGFNRVSRESMSIQDANRLTLEMLKADAKFMKRHILAAILNNASYTFEDEVHGALTVVPLANNDSVVYEKITGASATANHYGAQEADIDDGSANPFPGIYNTLMSYGSNRGRNVITYIADDLEEDVKALADFVAYDDPAILRGADEDRLIAGIPDVGPGEEIIGRVHKHWIAKWATMPSGYMLSVVVDAEMPIIFQRNMPYPNLQGFFPERNGGDGNLSQLSLIRMCGFGVRNRLAGYAYKVGAASYAAPTAFATVPLAG